MRCVPAAPPPASAAVKAAQAARDEHVMALMPEFISSRRGMVADLIAAAARQDRAQAHLLVHTLAGSFGMYDYVSCGAAG